MILSLYGHGDIQRINGEIGSSMLRFRVEQMNLQSLHFIVEHYINIYVKKLNKLEVIIMNYKEELEELYLQLNRELIQKRGSRVYNIDKYKIAVASLEQQIKSVKELLDNINKQCGGEDNGKPRVRFD